MGAKEVLQERWWLFSLIVCCLGDIPFFHSETRKLRLVFASSISDEQAKRRTSVEVEF